MTQAIQWTRRASKDIERASPSDRARILGAIERFAGTGEGDVRRLVNVYPPRYRLRVGDWRALFTVEHVHQPPGTIVILRVRRRDKAYA